MMSDVKAVMWKEWRELTLQRTTRIGFLIIVGVFGVILPLAGAGDKAASTFQLFSWGFLPFSLTIPLIADAFAGERERHTLETLLATRLTEADILLGKIGTTVTYALSGVLAANVMQVIVRSARAGAFDAPPIDITIAGFVLSFAIALLAASAGVLVSLRAKTVRQAGQVLGFSLMGLFFGAQILFEAAAFSNARASLFRFLGTHSPAAIALAGAGVVLAVDAVLIAAARAAFRRDKLLLD